jgi:hypothetical protein
MRSLGTLQPRQSFYGASRKTAKSTKEAELVLVSLCVFALVLEIDVWGMAKGFEFLVSRNLQYIKKVLDIAK